MITGDGLSASRLASLSLLVVLAAGCAGRQAPESAPGAVAATDETGRITPGAAIRAASGAVTDYLVYVVAESADQIALVRFGPDGARVDHVLRTGLMPTEINGPHGVAVEPGGRHYYVSIAHGQPFGTLWKYTTDGDSVVARTTLGMFPATVQVTPDGAFAFVVNFNLHGDMVPSSVSVVATEDMSEVARIRTCTMPHGSRINAQGTRHYSACMMDDMLVEIDTRTLAVSRHFMLSAGKEQGMSGSPAQHAGGAHAGHTMPAADPTDRPGSGSSAGSVAAQAHDRAMAAGSATCTPTWAVPSADGNRVFVACNKSSEIVEIDVERWTLVRRLPAGPGVYNLAVSPDGRLLVGTNKRGQSVSVYDAASGRELALVPTKRKIVHGVIVSPDSRYAFVTVEGIGSEPGTLEVIDLSSFRTVATVDLGQQAAGIDFYRMEPAR